MFAPASYNAALFMMLVTMICWGSWANMQKATTGWRFELFYWDYAIGVLGFSILAGLTLGSFGSSGQAFFPDLFHAELHRVLDALMSGIIFNVANILLVAAIAIAGLAVAFPIGIGIALLTGTILSWVVTPVGNLALLIPGVLLVLFAILLDAAAYRKQQAGQVRDIRRGVAVSVAAGILMGVFYPLLALAMEEPGGLYPYAAFFCFSLGLFACTIPVNLFFMQRPITGDPPVPFSAYLEGSTTFHAAGIIGGIIWALGTLFNLLAVPDDPVVLR